MIRNIAFITGVALAAVSMTPASANVTRTFTACVGEHRGECRGNPDHHFQCRFKWDAGPHIHQAMGEHVCRMYGGTARFFVIQTYARSGGPCGYTGEQITCIYS